MEYNELTKRLLAEGCSISNHPNYVKIPSNGFLGDSDALNNIDGGFVYKREYIYQKTFQTPCGLLCKGTSVLNGMCYMGLVWTYENDLTRVHCPYHDNECRKRHKYLQKEQNLPAIWCDVHLTEKRYAYDGSIEDLKKKAFERERQKKQEFIEYHNGRICENHMFYNELTEEWHMRYNPLRCAKEHCQHKHCGIRGRDLSKKKGNVFFDVKIVGRDYSKDGTFFEGERYTYITKNVRRFESPVNLETAQAYVRSSRCEKDIMDYLKNSGQYGHLFFNAYMQNLDWNLEVINIRAEQRESRDLEQDLLDLKEGIKITYDADEKKRLSDRKRENAAKSLQKRIDALEKKITENGFSGLADNEKPKAEKLITKERIAELEKMRGQKQEDEKNKPVQMSLFDFM